MRTVHSLLGAILLTSVAALAASPAWAAKDDTLLVSRASGPKGAGGTGGSFAPSISADGRLVAFESVADNLQADDRDAVSDVFVRDIVGDTLTLVSRAGGAKGAGGDDASSAPAISADGRYVAFVSLAGNLDAADTDGAERRSDVYVRDLKTNTTRLVSRASGAGAAKANGESYGPSISGDGRYVAFVSVATNLDAQDTDDTEDIYVRDLKTATTTLVTRPVLNVPKNLASSTSPSISANGRFVAFLTGRDDLSAASSPTDYANDVLVRDMQTGAVELVSRATGPDGAPADDDAGHPTISADGRLVAFHSLATNLAAGDDKRYTDVFVRDREAKTTALVTAIPGVPQSSTAGGEAISDAISGDGRYVTFNTSAPGLYPDGGHLNAMGEPVSDVFVRDLKAGTTTLVSRASGAAGAYANDWSSNSVVSDGGRFVAFASSATNLHPDAVAAANTGEDEEPANDIYVRDVLGPTGVARARADAPPRCPANGRVITGTERADVRTGGPASDVMFGLAGNDVLRGAGGRDCLYGQLGSDRLLGQGAGDWLWGGPGSDGLDGGPGGDRLRGQDGNDRLAGGSGRDSLTGGAGRDRLDGGSGRDRLRGGAGADRLFGGSGADRLTGGSGRDRLHGDAGDDLIADHSGRDGFWGGAGDDRIDARDGARGGGRRRADVVACGAGAHDVARVDGADRVARDCERVVRRR
jgi:Tol biopolymer transport system component